MQQSQPSKTTLAVLRAIARGQRYEQILAAYPDLTHLDIFAAAAEALALIGATPLPDYKVNVVAPTDPVQQPPPTAATIYNEHVAEVRRTCPRAYEKWTETEEAQLKEAFVEGKSEMYIAVLLQRQPGAVHSRLMKLGLLVPGTV